MKIWDVAKITGIRYILGHGEDIGHSPVQKKTQIQKPRGAALFSLRQKTRLYAQI